MTTCQRCSKPIEITYTAKYWWCADCLHSPEGRTILRTIGNEELMCQDNCPYSNAKAFSGLSAENLVNRCWQCGEIHQ
jgi:hypothetical protein